MQLFLALRRNLKLVQQSPYSSLHLFGATQHNWNILEHAKTNSVFAGNQTLFQVLH